MIGGKPADAPFDIVDPQEGDRLATEEPAPPADWTTDPAPMPEEAADARLHSGWIAPLIAILAIAAWLGGMLWLAWPAIQQPLPPLALVQFVAALCVPPTLIGILYLLTLRTSRAEARRFGATARAMRAEAAALERMVSTLSRKIEANRVALAEQVTQLLAIGERAAERVEGVATAIGTRADQIDASTRTLFEAASDAERRVDIVLASLPRAQDEIRGMAERLDETALRAGQHAAALDVQLSALTERGREADRIAGGAAERLAAHVARMEATGESAGARLEQVTESMSAAVDNVLDRAAHAVDEARKGIAAQGGAILAMLSANQAALDRAGRDSAEALGSRMTEVEALIARIGERLAQEHGRGDALFGALSAGVERLDRELGTLHATGTERAQALAASISALHGSMDAMGEAMRSGEALARKVIGTSEDLLTALDASAREMDETLPAALDRLDDRIAASRQVVAASKPELLALVTAAESTHDAIEAIADVVSQQRDTLAKTQASLLQTLESGSDQAQALSHIVDDTINTTRRFAESAAPQLVESLVRVRETASAAADHARQSLALIVPTAERALEEAGNAAFRRAVDASVRHQLTELAETTEAAVSAAARASERLTQQMVMLAETTAKIEAQLEAGRAEREQSDSDNFARRVSLLIEALHSASIDITKAFSAEVTDSAWTAYLKGDRGVFTRRAVRLLDPTQSRDILRFYDEDARFRDNVNRYIHDFEAMLRQILALRDGSPLGVTLLSSDMGKLYVALAQAIERLRT